ncbi:cell division protein SepF [Streptococcus dentapri]|uniref:Cell division protein SepF n=1 Tax=Streptococcus dentapri TaxID=573564 RepID=A0ABV8CZ57_9STRE
MAIKDRFEKIVSYFDTDDANEVEETQEETTTTQGPRPVRQPQQQAPQRQQQVQSQQQPQSQQRSQAATRQYAQGQAASHRSSQEENVRDLSSRSAGVAAPAGNSGTTIALKFPRKYEDAQEIVDLLIKHECVLIDFQYMLEAQARRCLDFIDGASRVLYGSLQKVGSSMYLLTPKDVVVDIEEMNLPNSSQEVSFDYDMKRR